MRIVDFFEDKALSVMQLQPPEDIDQLERKGVRAVATLSIVTLGAVAMIGAKYGVYQLMNHDVIMPFRAEPKDAVGQSTGVAVDIANYTFATLSIGANALGTGLAATSAAVMNRIRKRYPDHIEILDTAE